MSNDSILKNFSGLMRSLDGETPSNNAYDMLNVDVNRGRLYFRRGFLEKMGQPTSYLNRRGFQFVLTYNGTSELNELISIDNIGGTIKPFSINTMTWARTEITNGGMSLSLEDKDHFIVQFNTKAYVIIPDGTITLYSHDIGTITSWDRKQDTTYVGSTDPTLTLTPIAPAILRQWGSTDTLVYTNSNAFDPTAVTATFEADGSLLLNAPSTDTGGDAGGWFDVQDTYPAAQDFSGHDYIFLEELGQNYIQFFTDSTVKPQLKIAGSFVTVTDAKFVRSPTEKKGCWIMYIKGMAGITAVQGHKVRIPCKPGRGATTVPDKNFVILMPIYGGGTYLEASTTGKRIWDSALDGDGVTYGIQFWDSVGLTGSAIVQKQIDIGTAHGFTAADYTSPVGSIIKLEATTPALPYDTVRFLRLDSFVPASPVWRLVSSITVAAAVPFVAIDRFIEPEIHVQTNISAGTVPPIQPAFQTTGLLCGTIHKHSFMVWCFKGTLGNIKMSRVLTEAYPNAAEELYASSVTYDANDSTHPANFTLNGDEAIAVISAGDELYYFGRNGVYAQAGNNPSSMTPMRQIPAREVIAGPRACCLFASAGLRKNSAARHGVVYLDKEGAVMSVYSVPQYQSDATSEPIELSKSIRGFIKYFLVDSQAQYGFTDLSTATLSYSIADKILRVAMGKREVVLRQDHFVSEGDYWEAYEYNLGTSGTISVSSCTDYSSSTALAADLADADASWSGLTLPLFSDDLYAASGPLPLGTSKKTNTLDITSLKTPYPLSTGAVPTSMKVRVERSKLGDLSVLETKVQPRLAGADLGANLAASYSLTDTDVVTEFVISSSLPTPAQMNAGSFGCRLQFTQEDSHVDWNDPTKWTFVLTGDTTTSMTVTPTYHGSAPIPNYVFYDISSYTEASLGPSGMGGAHPVAPYSGYGTADNGFDSTVSGPLYTPAIVDPNPTQHQIDSSTNRVKIPLSGGTGSITITRAVSGTGSPAGIIVLGTYTGSAAFSPYIPATVQVDDVEVKVCYDLTTINPSLPAIAWTTNGKNDAFYWGLSTGQVHEVNYDSFTKTWITGTNRDGGRAPVDAYWESGDMRSGSITRLEYVIPEIVDPSETSLVVSARSDQKPALTPGIRQGHQYKFGVTQQGRSHRVRFTFSEGFSGVAAARIEQKKLSEQRGK